MHLKRWMCAFTSGVVLLSGLAVAQGNGHGHGHGKHNRDYMRGWYHDHDRDDHLPPGLAKRDQLPPGLERQLRVRGTLPPGLRKKMMPCPEEIEQRLPPPPINCEHVVMGGMLCW